MENFDDLPINGNFGQCGTYTISHKKTGRIYIGSSNDMPRRARTHKSQLKNNCHPNWDLQRAYNDDPEIEFFFIITEDREAAYDREEQLINHWKDKVSLFNIATDVRNGVANLSEESIAKIKQAITGLSRTEETRDKIRQAKLGIKRPAHIGEKIRQAKLGIKLSDITRSKMSMSRKGGKKPPRTKEHIDKIRIAKLGYKHSPETIDKIRNGLTNRRSVMIDGNKYDSILDAAKAIGKDHKTIRHHLNRGREGWSYI